MEMLETDKHNPRRPELVAQGLGQQKKQEKQGGAHD